MTLPARRDSIGFDMYYFAYGVNLNRRQMAERCPEAKPYMSAVLPNYRLVFSGWSRVWRGGVASIQPSSGDKVLGGVYEITDACLARLDGYEGYPSEYTRQSLTVFPDTGPPIAAIAYMRPRQLEETKPSAEYLAAIQQGYREWGLV